MEKLEIINLINKMTIEEKVLQLVQLGPHYFNNTDYNDPNNPFVKLNIDQNYKYNIGSVLGIGSFKERSDIQNEYLKNNRLKIPLMFMADIIHGCNIIFPIPLSLASSFNLDLASKVAKLSALDASLSGIDVTFSPMLDISRDARWGRIMESFGEDSYLCSLMGGEFVKGYQGNSLKNSLSVASCLKHYLGYGAAMAGRDYNNVELSHHTLVSEYIKPYEISIERDAKMVMTSFNTLDNMPLIGNKWAMNYLRDTLNFKGVIITDYAAVNELITYGVADNSLDASIISIKNGVDIDMASGCYVSLIDYAKKTPSIIPYIDESVKRVLMLKNDLGLFENPNRIDNKDLDKKDELLKNLLTDNYDIQKECITLLKNENVLPLKQFERVAIIGKFSNSKDYNGSWSWHQDKSINQTLVDSFKELNYKVEYVSSEYLTKLIPLYINRVDKVIVTIGEPSFESGEAKSKVNISLVKEQVDFIKKLSKYDVPIIGIYYSGRPLILSEIDEYLKGLLITFFLGSNSSRVIRDTLYGSINPSAKLPVSFMRHAGQYPYSYSNRKVGRPVNDEYAKAGEYLSSYLDCLNSPLYPFGYGLTYSNISVTEKTIKSTGTNSFSIEVKLKNDSNYKAKEVVQVYMRILLGVVVPKNKQLIAFKKVEINKQSSKTIKIPVNYQSFIQVDENLKSVLEDCDVDIYVGLDSNCDKLTRIKIQGGII